MPPPLGKPIVSFFTEANEGNEVLKNLCSLGLLLFDFPRADSGKARANGVSSHFLCRLQKVTALTPSRQIGQRPDVNALPRHDS
jgi:hypothetical protein